MYSNEDNAELTNMTMTTNIIYIWIGLYRGHFSQKWSNGDPITFITPAVDCGLLKPCCVAMKPNGSWEILDCTGTKYFMCYEQGNF